MVVNWYILYLAVYKWVTHLVYLNLVATCLKEARLRAKISQKKLGIAAGIDEFSASARMNQYEAGKHVSDLLTLKRISKVLKVPLAYFYAEDDILVEFLVLFESLKKPARTKLLKFIDMEVE